MYMKLYITKIQFYKFLYCFQWLTRCWPMFWLSSHTKNTVIVFRKSPTLTSFVVKSRAVCRILEILSTQVPPTHLSPLSENVHRRPKRKSVPKTGLFCSFIPTVHCITPTWRSTWCFKALSVVPLLSNFNLWVQKALKSAYEILTARKFLIL